MCSWRLSSCFQGGPTPFFSFMSTCTLAFWVSAVTHPFDLVSVGTHGEGLIKETWYFPYMLSRHLTWFSACSGSGKGVKGTCSPVECSPVAQPTKKSTGGCSSKSYCLSALKHHLSTPGLAQNSNEALENSGICKLVCLWRIQTF